MKENKLFSFIKVIISDIFSVWYKELKNVFSDVGVFIFFFIVPLGYPLLYSYIYNNEVVREVPIVVVDQNRTSFSRDYLRRIDASPEVNISSNCSDMEEAKEKLRRHEAFGILLIPESFSRNIAQGRQSTASLYSDMSSMLFYKAMLSAVSEVSLAMGKEIQVRNIENITSVQGQRITTPVRYESVGFYNPQAGFASFVVPGILVLLLQQTLLLGVGMLVGTNRNRTNSTFQINYGKMKFIGSLRIVMGKALCYFMIYAIVSVWVLRAVPVLFKFPMIGHPIDLVLFLLPYLLSAIFFAITLSGIIRDRETPMLIFVFSSLPLLFLAGVSWPPSAIPLGWKWFSYIFPSTFGIQGFLKINTMGAEFWQVKSEYIALWVQTFVYFCTACMSYHYLISDRRTLRNELLLKRKMMVHSKLETID